MTDSPSFILLLILLLFLGGTIAPDPRRLGLEFRLVVGAAAWGILGVGWVIFVQMSIRSFGPLGGVALTGLLMYASARVARMTY